MQIEAGNVKSCLRAHEPTSLTVLTEPSGKWLRRRSLGSLECFPSVDLILSTMKND